MKEVSCMTHLNPKDCREEHGVYSNTKPYQKMTESQRMIFDHAEANGRCGAKRRSDEEVAKWKDKRAKMTKAELEEMELQDELNKKTGTWMLIGLGIALAIFCTMLIVGELTGNSLVENFTGTYKIGN